MYKLTLFLIYFCLHLANIECQSFKCPPISRYNESMEMADVCICNDKQRRIMCRVKIYNLQSFELVPDYTDFIRRSLTYDRTHLSIFQLCFNINYNAKQQMPLVQIGAQLMSELSFDQIVISYCDHKHTNPIKLELEPNFLEMQTETVHKLEIEIPAGVENNGSQVLFDLAQAMAPTKRLEFLVIWMDAKLYLHIPDHLFGQYSPFSYVVPLAEILFTNHHDQVEGDNQVISIGSFTFLNLKRLKLITLQVVVVHKVAAFAFAALYPISQQLTVNFTNCNLQQTIFDQKAFLGLNRVATIYFGNSASLPKPEKLFIPSKEIFSEFLLENAGNKLKLDNPLDCSNREVHEKIKWMFDEQNRLSTKQLELLCHNGKSIFKYFKV